ncbi:MAG: hypothetical protein ACJ78Q_10760 [Chloroflexia bacterium]
MIENAITALNRLQEVVAQRNVPDAVDSYIERVYFCNVARLLHVEFYGRTFDSYLDFLGTLRNPDVVPHLKSVALRGPDEGANGTRNWDLVPLVETEIVFPQLSTFFIEPTAPEHHNSTIVAQDYAEAGVLARLLVAAPKLEALTTPSAPDASFFEVDARPLSYLRIDAGYDAQDFIQNLSKSNCFPNLRHLDYGDYNERYMKDYPNGCTPCEHYQMLLHSLASASMRTFILRNSICTPEELSALKASRNDLSIMAVQSYGGYVY